MAENIKSRLRSASRSDPEASEDDSTDLGRHRSEQSEHRWSLISSKTTGLVDAGDMLSPALVEDDDERSGGSTGDLDATVVAPVAVHTEDESTVASSDGENTPEQPRVRTTVEQMMVVDYQRRDEDQMHLQEGALAKIRKKLLAGDSLVAGDEVDSSVCAVVKERFVMDTQGVYVTFDVPRSHRLFGKYVAVDRSQIPAGATVEYIPGAVGPQLAVLQTGDAVAREQSVKPSQHDSLVSPRSAKLRRLEEELEKVKADLKRPETPVDGSGDASQPGTSRRVGFQRAASETELVSGPTAGRSHNRRRRPVTDTDRSQSEYETCFDSDADAGRFESPGAHDSRGRRRRRRRGSSGGESDTTGATALVDMMRTCMKETLASIVEELPGRNATEEVPVTVKTDPEVPHVNNPTSVPRAGGPVPMCAGVSGVNPAPSGTTPPTTVAVTLPDVKPPPSADFLDMGITDVRSLAPKAIPLAQANLPLTTISKFDGEYWSEFIEYFESVADANAWSEKEKLTYLLMSIEGKPRAYAKSEKGVAQTYENVKKRLESRYGQHEPAFQVRQQLREVRRFPNERLEDFADRLQEIAQRGSIDARDRNDLFYQAFLGAVKSTPKLQHFIEEEHYLRRDLTIGDLLALTRRYMDRNPTETVLGGRAAVNVCKPVTQRKGELSHDDAGVKDDVAQEQARTQEEREERKQVKAKGVHEQLAYLDHELDWLKKICKAAKLHHTGKPFNGKKDGGKWKKGKKDGANGGTSRTDSDGKTGVNSMQTSVDGAAGPVMAESEE